MQASRVIWPCLLIAIRWLAVPVTADEVSVLIRGNAEVTDDSAIAMFASSQAKDERLALVDGLESLFDGVSFAGWKHLPGHVGHWTTQDNEIHYDGKAQEEKRFDKDLWTTKEFADFTLVVDWRLPAKPTLKPHPVVLPNGDFVFEQGQRKTFQHLDAGDSGIYLRGSSKCQINIWSQQLGSGEINGFRTDSQLPPAVRKACLPIVNADYAFGKWNRFVITMQGQRVTVALNGATVIDNAQLPGVPKRGPIGLQHHNDPVQFRNLYIREFK